MLSFRGKVVVVFVVAFFSTFFIVYVLPRLADSLPFDSKASLPVPDLAFCVFVVIVLGVFWFNKGGYRGYGGHGDWDGGESDGGGGGGSSGFDSGD